MVLGNAVGRFGTDAAEAVAHASRFDAGLEPGRHRLAA
jgi:hypothetical protein